MRKIAVIALILCVASVAYAATESRQVYDYVVKTTSGVYETHVIPTTSIRPKVDKLVGYSIMRNTENTRASECVIGVYDGTDVYLTGECFGEAESIDESTNGELWASPKSVENGVVIRQGPNTIARVYFIRT